MMNGGLFDDWFSCLFVVRGAAVLVLFPRVFSSWVRRRVGSVVAVVAV